MARKKSYHKKPEEIINSKKLKEKYSIYNKHSQNVFNLITLVVISLASMITTLVTMPFMLFFNSYLMYGFILLIGLIFGLIFSFMVIDLKHIERKGHLFLSILVPIIAILNIIIMIFMAKHLTTKFNLTFEHNPFILATLYLLGYVIPYLFFSLLIYVRQKNR
jgi:cation transport ATPase